MQRTALVALIEASRSQRSSVLSLWETRSGRPCCHSAAGWCRQGSSRTKAESFGNIIPEATDATEGTSWTSSSRTCKARVQGTAKFPASKTKRREEETSHQGAEPDRGCWLCSHPMTSSPLAIASKWELGRGVDNETGCLPAVLQDQARGGSDRHRVMYFVCSRLFHALVRIPSPPPPGRKRSGGGFGGCESHSLGGHPQPAARPGRDFPPLIKRFIKNSCKRLSHWTTTYL